MKAFAFVALFALVPFLQEGQPRVAFATVEVWIDAGDAELAAYQFELRTAAKITGVEGNHPTPPWYDPRALHEGGRIIIAEIHPEGETPKGRVRVARLHMMEEGAADYTAQDLIAVSKAGVPVDAKIEVVRLEK